MNEWIAGLNLQPWMPVAAAYLFGIATGWLIWGGRQSQKVTSSDVEMTFDEDGFPVGETEADRTEPSVDEIQSAKALFSGRDGAEQNNADMVPNSMKLGALESELRKAQEMLNNADEERDNYEGQLGELEQALKRANGRLKLVMKAVKKVKAD